ncbi:MAG: OB-fold domain-containing protein [Dehalococcoidia bacterium]
MSYLPEGMPLPNVKEPDSAEFWAAAKRHELVVQHCTDCGTYRHTPMPICYVCRSFSFEWAKLSGKGVVFTYTIIHNPVHSALKERCPFNVVVVELPEAGNVRMVGNLIDCPDDQIKVGMPVQVAWDDINDDVTLPLWRPAD